MADLEISVVEQPEDDESESLWSSVMNSIDDQTFEEIIQNEDNENFVEWMKIEFKKTEKSNTARLQVIGNLGEA